MLRGSGLMTDGVPWDDMTTTGGLAALMLKLSPAALGRMGDMNESPAR
jgi:hypothetical protein